jgi:hypothetical protein
VPVMSRDGEVTECGRVASRTHFVGHTRRHSPEWHSDDELQDTTMEIKQGGRRGMVLRKKNKEGGRSGRASTGLKTCCARDARALQGEWHSAGICRGGGGGRAGRETVAHGPLLWPVASGLGLSEQYPIWI